MSGKRTVGFRVYGVGRVIRKLRLYGNLELSFLRFVSSS
jgi:hypothetical protein